MFRFLTTLVVALVFFILGSLLVSLPLMLLWNGCLVPAVSILHEISWLQAWGILFACGMLFKGMSFSNKKK